MPNTICGSLTPPAGRFAIVAAQFNRAEAEALVEGAVKGLRENGVADENIDLAWVPGSFEIPLAAQAMAKTGRYLAVIGLGAVIRGETDHYEHVCRQAAAGILQAGLTTGVPVLFGVLTCATEEQARDRAGGKCGNKGFEVALAALEMVNLLKQIRA